MAFGKTRFFKKVLVRKEQQKTSDGKKEELKKILE